MFEYQNFFSFLPSCLELLYQPTSFVWQALNEMPKLLQTYSHKIQSPISEHVVILNKETVSIGKNTIIDPFVMIEGPCIIGDHCHIRHGAYIRANTFIGNSSVIGHGCEIKSSILHPFATIAHLCYVGDTIVGSYTNLSAGVKCANLRLDRKEVVLRYNDQKIPTGLKKFGAIIADHVQIGCNSVLNPGTVIGKQSIIYPLCNPKGIILENCVVKKNEKLEDSLTKDNTSKMGAS